MALLDVIEGASLIIIDPDERLAYAWFGGTGVNVYDEEGNEVHYFTIGGTSKVTAATVRAAVRRVIADSAEGR